MNASHLLILMLKENVCPMCKQMCSSKTI